MGGQFQWDLLLKDLMKGGHGNQSQHYAGVAFDVGQTLSSSQRNRLWNSANDSGVWAYVEPIRLTPTWVHFDKRFGKPACSTGGFPTIRRGSLSNYVLIAQDDLNTLGFRTGGLDGIFGGATQNAVIAYQRSRGLSADGIVGCNTWRSLQENVVGTGATSTTIN
ncbi:MAG: peptidoglycan-binding protein [Clostridia bacterium]|nr:peptidoglycan-binding protein [Clostridia bacterium]